MVATAVVLVLTFFLAAEGGYRLSHLHRHRTRTGDQLEISVPVSTPAEESFIPFGRPIFFHFSVVVSGFVLAPSPSA